MPQSAVYTNTLFPSHFRLLGILQGGYKHIAFATPYPFLHTSVSSSIRQIAQDTRQQKYAYIKWDLVPELPELFPPRQGRRRDRMLEVPGQTRDLFKRLSPSRSRSGGRKRSGSGAS
ncbi:hypothetical protein JCM11251_000471 [Rhodosporidiobolus azoricus]